MKVLAAYLVPAYKVRALHYGRMARGALTTMQNRLRAMRYARVTWPVRRGPQKGRRFLHIEKVRHIKGKNPNLGWTMRRYLAKRGLA